MVGATKEFLASFKENSVDLFLKYVLITTGITALFLLRVLIKKEVCDLDVGLGFPKGAEAFDGWSVRPLKPYMIWVQTDVSQVSFYLFLLKRLFVSTKGPH